jgi:hypothetical protein
MDILVTTPKSAHKLAKEEAEYVKQNPNSYWFRTIRGKPDVQVGDRVYYVDNGVITGYGIVFDIEYGELQCETTGRIYKGTHLKQREWKPLKHSIRYKGFQGFRYIDRISGLKDKLTK